MLEPNSELNYNNLREAITSFEGVPTAHSLARIFEGSTGITNCSTAARISKLIGEHEDLQHLMFKRGKDFIEGLDEKGFFRQFSMQGWVTNLPPGLKLMAEQKIDNALLETMRSINGIVYEKSMEDAIHKKGIEGTHRFIWRRIEGSKNLMDEAEKRSSEHILALTDGELKKKASSGSWVSCLPGKARETYDARRRKLSSEAAKNMETERMAHLKSL